VGGSFGPADGILEDGDQLVGALAGDERLLFLHLVGTHPVRVGLRRVDD
jgi:hypothetical protein